MSVWTAKFGDKILAHCIECDEEVIIGGVGDRGAAEAIVHKSDCSEAKENDDA